MDSPIFPDGYDEFGAKSNGAWTPDEVSEVIVLRAVGLSWGQIAQRLGKTKSQVQRLHVRHTERLAR